MLSGDGLVGGNPTMHPPRLLLQVYCLLVVVLLFSIRSVLFCDSASELERYGLHFFLGVFLPSPASCFSEIVIFRNLLHNFSRVLGLSLVFFFCMYLILG